MRFRSLCFLGLLGLSTRFCVAWDYAGHRMVNLLALASLPRDFPEFTQTPSARERVGFLAGEPDRWRNSPDLALRNVNGPDHFFDFEWVQDAGFTPDSLPELRYVYDQKFSQAVREHPERFPAAVNEPSKDQTRQLAGFLPWAIVENYAKLKSAFSYLKAYEEAGSPEEIENARENVLYVMGVMGHYVGDAAQPLHLTQNYNGWSEEANPHGYTRSKTFHAWIDGGFFQKTGGLSYNTLVRDVHAATLLRTHASADERDQIFSQTIEYLLRQYAKVSTVYELDKAGALSPSHPQKGRAFLDHQLIEAAEMLGRLWYTAWRDAPPDTFLRGSLLTRKLQAEQK